MLDCGDKGGGLGWCCWHTFCLVSGSTSHDALLVILDNECGVRNDRVLSGNVVVCTVVAAQEDGSIWDRGLRHRRPFLYRGLNEAMCRTWAGPQRTWS